MIASPRRDRLIEALPVLASLAVFSVALDRAIFALLAAVAICFIIWRGVETGLGALGLTLAGITGGAIGFVLGTISDLPRGPIPPSVLGPLSGALVGSVVWSVLQRRSLYSWTYAWLLVVICLNTPANPALWVTLALLAVATLVAVFHGTRLGRSGVVGWVGYTLFAGAVGGSAIGLAAGVRASEGTLANLVYEYLRGLDLPSGVGFDSSVALLTRSSVEPQSRVLFEIDGHPERLRTAIYDAFDGAQFSTSFDPAAPAQPPPPAPPGLHTASVVLFESLGQRWPALAGTRRIGGAATQLRPGWIWHGQSEPGRTITLDSTEQDLLPPEPAPDASLTALPANLVPDFKAIADGLLTGTTTVRERAHRVETWLQQEFTYSLRTDLRGQGHPLLVMLREKRPAYCIYFASAMAVLLRTQGIATRLVGGFLVVESNRLTGRSVVRQRDSHAWVEAYLPEENRWVAFDPTPSTSRDELLGLQRSGGWLFDLGGAITSTLRRTWAAFRADPGGFLADLATSPWVVVPAAIAGAWVLWRRRRAAVGAVRTRTALQADPKLRALYAKYLQTLATWQLAPAPGESDDELLARLRLTHAPIAGPAAQFLRAYRDVRYGPEQDLSAVEALLGRIPRR